MAIRGHIDGSFTTEQRDLFTSGLVGEIGANAYAVWNAIKCYADFNTGEAFPGLRTLGKKLGMSPATVMRAVGVLVTARMVRIVRGHSKTKGQTYIARERLSVSVGRVTLCTIVIDYVPTRLRGQIKRLMEVVKSGQEDPQVFADVEIIPGPGFDWDVATGTLRGRIESSELHRQQSNDTDPDDYHRQLGSAYLAKLVAVKK